MRLAFLFVPMLACTLAACASSPGAPGTLAPDAGAGVAAWAVAMPATGPDVEPSFRPSPFRHRIDGNEIVDPQSAAKLNAIFYGDRNNPYRIGELQVAAKGDTRGLTGPQFPVYDSVPSDPHFRIHCSLYGSTCALEGRTINIPAGALPQDGYDRGGEGHMDIVSPAEGKVYALYEVHSAIPRTSGSLTVGFAGICPLDAYASGGTCAQGTTAGNLPESALLLRVSEWRAAIAADGDLGHSLYISTCTQTGPPAYPATGSAGMGRNNGCLANGQLIILKLSDAKIRALDVPPWERVMLLTYAHFGLMADDGGTYQWSFGAEDDNDRIARGLAPEWPDFIANYITPFANEYGYYTNVAKGSYHVYFPQAGITPADFQIVSLRKPG
jgi:hypothetical protein